MQIPACHGVGIRPQEIGLQLGWLADPPPSEFAVELAEDVARSRGAELVWTLEEPPGHGLPAITVQTWREPDGSTWFGNTLNMRLRIGYSDRRITVAAKNGNQQVTLEALASVALPFVAQHQGGLVIHGSAVGKDGQGVLVCAQSGSGKSSLLMGMAAQGWQAISEDQCVVDWDQEGRHRLWPGPSWVRLKKWDTPKSLVLGRKPRFEALDKNAWDLSEWMAHTPVRVRKIVLLEPPGGDAAVWEEVTREYAIPRLGWHVTWMDRREDFPGAVLPHVVRLLMEVPVYRMRLPVREDWLKLGIHLLSEA